MVLQDNIPHLNQTFTLELPPNFTYGTVWAHAKQTPPVDLEHQHWRWVMNETPAIDLKDVRLRPAIDSLEGRMTVHYTGPGLPTSTEGTWKSIGEWYQVLYKDRIVATPEITAKATELTAGKSDFYDKTEAIAEFVQKQVRYFAIELGIGGYQPPLCRRHLPQSLRRLQGQGDPPHRDAPPLPVFTRPW